MYSKEFYFHESNKQNLNKRDLIKKINLINFLTTSMMIETIFIFDQLNPLPIAFSIYLLFWRKKKKKTKYVSFLKIKIIFSHQDNHNYAVLHFLVEQTQMPRADFCW